MSANYVLSVAMPTHNRSHYAILAIASILAIPSADIQLVVSDTSTDGLLYELLNSYSNKFLSDPRLKYVRVKDRSNITDNYNRSVAQCDGEYICLIGDDDTITTNLVYAARWALNNSELIISQAVTSNYAWPDFRSRFFGLGHAARLYIPRTAGVLSERNSADDLERALAHGLQGPTGLPLCYHGLVHRSLYLAAKNRAGSYFHGSSPDISGAISLALLTERYLETDFPLTIPGAGGGSNTGRAAMNDHKGSFDKEVQTSIFSESGWLPGIPRFFSAETTWAHAGLSTVAKFDEGLATKFNYLLLLGLCKARHPEFADEVNIALNQYCEMFSLKLSQETAALNAIVRNQRFSRIAYIMQRALRPTVAGGRRFIGGIRNIAEARVALEEYIALNKASIVFPFK